MPDIIIVGAGPTGLMLSNQLTRFGIDHVILDQKSGPTDQSRALVVHARSMEIYEQLGLSDQVLASAQKGDGMDIYRDGRLVASATVVDPHEDRTPFPGLMMYEQSKNEHLLYKNIRAGGREVEWNTCISTITSQDDLFVLDATRDGSSIRYTCKYLIACDGSKSIVRDFSQVPFLGSSYMNVFFVVDTRIDCAVSSSKISMFLSNDDLTALFPIIGDHHFRVLGVLPKEYYHREDLPFADILEKVKASMQMPATFHDDNWHSTYRLHHKKVERFSKGKIFFAGDAAHVHSPVGGQGMNTGLQDAYNLAWKMSLVMKGMARASLLDTYHEERNPVAENLLKSTDRMFSFMSSDRPVFNFVRMHFLPGLVSLLTRSKSVRRKLFWAVSQIGVGYPSSSLAKGAAGRMKAGTRLPYFMIEQGGAVLSVYAFINNRPEIPFTVLLFNAGGGEFGALDTRFFKVLALEANAFNLKAIRKAGLPGSFVLVIRPDNYVGYAAAHVNVGELSAFMQQAYSLAPATP
jgi:2-polyprenyl-6-methoxyphenol hydroxylase-like FAD-dependent oxidoreductase